MAQVIRQVDIVVNLKSGPVTLQVPDLTPMTQQLEKQLELIQKMDQAYRTAAQTQQQGGPGGGGGSASSGSSRSYSSDATVLERVVRLTNELAEARARVDALPVGQRGEALDRVLELNEQLNTAQEKAARSAQIYYRQVLQGANQAATGVYQLTRGFALLGAEDESMQQLVKSLAQVQAAFDLIHGAVSIIIGLQKAFQALTLAREADTAATLTSTEAQVANTAASAGLLAKLGEVGLVIGVAIGVIYALKVAYDALTESEKEAADKAKKAAEEAQKWHEAEAASLDKVLSRETQIAQLRASTEDAPRRADLLSQAAEHLEINASGEFQVGDSLKDSSPAAAAARFQEGNKLLAEASQLRQQAIQAIKEQERNEAKIVEDRQRQIEQSQKQVELAQKQVEVEEAKERKFRAQIGLLEPWQIAQLKVIDAQVKAGNFNPTKFQEDILAKAGERGHRILDDVGEQRFKAAGIDDATFLGGPSKELAKSQDALKDAIDKLAEALNTQGTTNSAEAIASLKQQVQAIEAQAAAQRDAINKLIGENTKLMETYNEKLKDMRFAVDHLGR